MPRSSTLAIALMLLALAGCGDEESGERPDTGTPQAQVDTDGDGVVDADDADPQDATIGAEKAVNGSVDLEMPAGGPPDAGTEAGHRAGAARGKTSEATFSFDGTISPPQSEVTVTARGEGAEATVRTVGDHGDFTVELSGLAPEANRFSLRATADGFAPWEQDIVITRR